MLVMMFVVVTMAFFSMFVVMTAVSLFVMMMVMLVVMLVAMTLFVVVVMSVAVALAVVVVMVFVMGLLQFFQKTVNLMHVALQSGQQGVVIQTFKVCGNQGSGSVYTSYVFHRLLKFCLADFVGFAYNNGIGLFDLVDIKLAEVFHIHTHLTAVGNGSDNVKLQICLNLFNGLYDIGKFTNTAWLDNNSFRLKL